MPWWLAGIFLMLWLAGLVVVVAVWLIFAPIGAIISMMRRASRAQRATPTQR